LNLYVLKKKKKINNFEKSDYILEKNNSAHTINFVSAQTNSNIQNFSYRLSFRYNYRQHLTINTNLKLKYLIENLIQQYFSLSVCVKLFWPLIQFKNVKFYRLFFPDYKQFNFKLKTLPWTLNEDLQIQNSQYFYVSQNTNHLHPQEQIAKLRNKFSVYKKLSQTKFVPSLLSSHVISSLSSVDKLQVTPNFLANSSKEKMKKKKINI